MPFVSSRTRVLAAVGAGALMALGIGLASHAPQAATRPSRLADASAGAGSEVGAKADPASRVPVLVELFTSEGCSSCPPADDLLARMVAEQPVPGADIVALGFHVDYWDRLGWRDRFSNARYTVRQNEYAYARNSDDVYTPQAIVDGRRPFVGSNWDAARKAIAEAAATPKLAVTLDAADAQAADRPSVRIDIQPSAASGDAGKGLKGDVLLAVSEDGLVSDVQRGENAKRRLTHVAVVRSLDKIGRFDGKTPFSATRPISIDRDWHRDGIKIVVFVQESGTLRVLGVASRKL